MSIGEQIRRARMNLGFTGASLAAASGLTRGFISQVESGKSQPSLASLERIAAALGVPGGSLVDEQPPSEHVAPKSEPPQLLAAPSIYQDNVTLSRLTKSARGSHFLMKLPPRFTLMSVGSHGRYSAPDALAAVLSGSVVFRQGTEVRQLSQHEICSWSELGGYAFENSGRCSANLLLFLPDSYTLPEIIAMPGTAGYLVPPSISVYAGYFDGPLRLVGMRARRWVEVERK